MRGLWLMAFGTVLVCLLDGGGIALAQAPQTVPQAEPQTAAPPPSAEEFPFPDAEPEAARLESAESLSQRTTKRKRLLALELEYQQYSLGMPIVLMAVGGAVAGVSLSLAFLVEVSCSSPYRRDDCVDGRSTPYLFAGAAGLVAVVAGLIWMLDRLATRRPIGHEIKALRLELSSTVDLAPTQRGLQLRMRF